MASGTHGRDGSVRKNSRAAMGRASTRPAAVTPGDDTHTQTHLGRRLTMVTQRAFQTSRGRSVPTLSPDTPRSVIQAEKLAGPFLDTPRSLIQAAKLEALLTLLDQLFEHPKMTFKKTNSYVSYPSSQTGTFSDTP